MRASVWKELDLDPTHDVRAIRSAYARRLKTIDVEEDAEAFIRLRQALDTALRFAASVDQPDRFLTLAVRPETETGESTPAGDVAPANAPGEAVDHGGLNPRTLPPIDQTARRLLEEQMRRLATALAGDASSSQAEDDIHVLADSILSTVPSLTLDEAARLEHWWVVTLEQTAPRSDTLLEPVIARFGWTEKANDWRTPPAISAALNRTKDSRFRNDISHPGHRWALAYSYLKALPPRFRQLPGIEQARIRDLLRTIRTEHPSLLAELNPMAVARWGNQKRRAEQAPSGRISVRLIVALLWAGFILIGVIVNAVGHAPGGALNVDVAASAELPLGCLWKDAGFPKPIISCLHSDQLSEIRFPEEIGPRPAADGPSADRGREALAGVGWFYASGAPPDLRDPAHGAALLRQAAAKGSVGAMYWLGMLNARPGGVTGLGPNLAEAGRWFAAAKAQGFAPAAYSLGLLRMRGLGGRTAMSDAAEDFRVAAAQGHAPAMAHLAYLYELNPSLRGKDRRTAPQLISSAAAAGDVDGLFLRGLQPLLKPFNQQALSRAEVDLKAAARKGSTAAMTTLAVLAATGPLRVAADPQKLLLQAAKLGNAEAMYDLGIMYAHGQRVPKDPRYAQEWLAKSAMAGFAKAQAAQSALASGQLGSALSAGCSLSCEARF